MKNGKAIILGILVAIGATVASANWTAPTASPPGGNAYPPLNTSSVNQAKQVGNTAGNYGGLGVGTFLATDTSYFLGDVSFGDPLDNVPPGDVYIQELKDGSANIVPVCVDGATGKLVICQ